MKFQQKTQHYQYNYPKRTFFDNILKVVVLFEKKKLVRILFKNIPKNWDFLCNLPLQILIHLKLKKKKKKKKHAWWSNICTCMIWWNIAFRWQKNKIKEHTGTWEKVQKCTLKFTQILTLALYTFWRPIITLEFLNLVHLNTIPDRVMFFR